MRTWLAPSLPVALFDLLARTVGERIGREVELTIDASASGPRPWVDDPFRRGEVDVGFLCSPSWSWLASGPDPSVVPVLAAPIPLDPRARGRPVYFSDVVVPASSRARSLADLAGTRWAYNDTCSLSGWLSLRARVPEPERFFARVVHSGSHLASLGLLADAAVDGAAIDSTVLGWVTATEPALASRIRVVESWGPHPIQPVVARAGLDPALVDAVADALATFRPAPRGPLARFGLAGFARSLPAEAPHRAPVHAGA